MSVFRDSKVGTGTLCIHVQTRVYEVCTKMERKKKLKRNAPFSPGGFRSPAGILIIRTNGNLYTKERSYCSNTYEYFGEYNVTEYFSFFFFLLSLSLLRREKRILLPSFPLRSEATR